MMDKTININIGGILFSLEEDAYNMLRDYLQSIDLKFRNMQGGNETIEDIELRIAEIFQSQRGTAGVITLQNVEEMISIIGQPEDFDQLEESDMYGDKDQGYQGSASQRKKLLRNTENKIFGGVCNGMGDYFDTDPVWFRILFIVLALIYGLGIFIYVLLWIALPVAATDSRTKEVIYSGLARNSSGNRVAKRTSDPASRPGNGVNEVFGAMGKGIYIIVRIFLIILGVSLVAAGFLSLFSCLMVLIFKFPAAFSTNAAGVHLTYIPDFLNYLVAPNIAPWIKALIITTVFIPLIAMIYGGIRLIFWFRANDGYLWLTGLILWILSAAALAILMFNEGIGYAETARSTSQNYFNSNPDTLYIISGAKLSALRYDNEIVLPDDAYSIYFSDENKEMYLHTSIDFFPSEDYTTRLDIRRRSAGRSERDALERADRLLYNFEIAGDTLIIDEYCTIPAGTKWSFDQLSLRLYAPEGTVIYMDRTTQRQLNSRNYRAFSTTPGNRYWQMTDDGLDYIGSRYRSDY